MRRLAGRDIGAMARGPFRSWQRRPLVPGWFVQRARTWLAGTVQAPGPGQQDVPAAGGGLAGVPLQHRASPPAVPAVACRQPPACGPRAMAAARAVTVAVPGSSVSPARG
jgi:hypothetical protein